MDPRDKWQVNDEALRKFMHGQKSGSRPMPAADPEPGWGLPRWLKVSVFLIVGFVVLVLFFSSRYSDEDHRRDSALREAELMCRTQMADARLGAERRTTREMCDDLLRRMGGKPLPP